MFSYFTLCTGKRYAEQLLAVVDRHSATGVDLCNLLKEVLHRDI